MESSAVTKNFANVARKLESGANNISYYWPQRRFPAGSAVVLQFEAGMVGNTAAFTGNDNYTCTMTSKITFLKGLADKDMLTYSNPAPAPLLGDAFTYSLTDVVHLKTNGFNDFNTVWSALFNPTHDFYGWKMEVLTEAFTGGAFALDPLSYAFFLVSDYVSIE